MPLPSGAVTTGASGAPRAPRNARTCQYIHARAHTHKHIHTHMHTLLTFLCDIDKYSTCEFTSKMTALCLHVASQY